MLTKNRQQKKKKKKKKNEVRSFWKEEAPKLILEEQRVWLLSCLSGNYQSWHVAVFDKDMTEYNLMQYQ